MIPAFLESRCDEDLYIYFDETNNLRKISLNIKKENGLNETNTLFVVGGVFYTYAANPLRMKTGFQKFFSDNKVKLDGTEEYKFKEFAQGGGGKNQQDFKKLLGSKKLNLFLRWLKKNRGYFHYSATDLRYFIFLDLIESDELWDEINRYANSLPNTFMKENLIMNFHFGLKTFFDKMLQFKQLEFFKKLHSIDFPDIEKVNIEILREIVASHISDYLSHNNISNEDERYVKPIKNIIEKTDFFLMLGNPDKPYRLMNSFTSLYFTRLLDFHKSTIYLDNEYDIEEDLKLLQNADLKEEVNNAMLKGLSGINYSFEKSDQNFNLQIADISIGLVKEFYTFCLCSDIPLNEWDDFIKEFDKNLAPTQSENIRLFFALHNKSLSRYNGIQHTTTPIDGRKKFDALLRYYNQQ